MLECFVCKFDASAFLNFNMRSLKLDPVTCVHVKKITNGLNKLARLHDDNAFGMLIVILNTVFIFET